ncbi:hypothetical protein SUGI_0016730 [Cryptomeria japonica]|nr:hypothetical protein SUGI_0016730 [Cryptomeria japonica]
MSSERRRFSLFKHSRNTEWPKEFICPISRLPMADPVIVCSGQSYERRCIEAWMKLGQRYCHVTGIDLHNSTVIANVALRTAIIHWCQAAGFPNPTSPDPEAANNLVLKLINQAKYLNSGNGYSSEPQKTRDFNEVSQFRALGHSDFQRPTSRLDADMLQQSMRNVSLEKSSTPTEIDKAETLQGINSDYLENSTVPTERNRSRTFSDDLRKLDPVPNLGRHYHSATQVGMMGIRGADTESSSSSSGYISPPPPLATKPSSYSSEAQKKDEVDDLQYSCPHVVSDLVATLSQSHALEQEGAVTDLRKQTRTSSESRIALCHPKLLSALLPLCTSRYPEVQINAVAALVNLSLEKENKVGIVRAGAIPYLIDVLKAGHPEAQEHAAGCIFSLALSDENKIAIGILGAIPPLIHILRAGEDKAKQDAAMALYHLSFPQGNKSKLVKQLQKDNNIRFVSLAIQAGVMEPLVWLSENGNARAKEKASVLLSMMKEVTSSEEEYPDSILPRHSTRRLGRAVWSGPNSTEF